MERGKLGSQRRRGRALWPLVFTSPVGHHLTSGPAALFSEVPRWGRGHGYGKVQRGAVLGSRHRSRLGQGCLHHPPVTTAGDDGILLAGLR